MNSVDRHILEIRRLDKVLIDNRSLPPDDSEYCEHGVSPYHPPLTSDDLSDKHRWDYLESLGHKPYSTVGE